MNTVKKFDALTKADESITANIVKSNYTCLTKICCDSMSQGQTPIS